MKIFSVDNSQILYDDLIEVKFTFSVSKVSEQLEEDEDFPYPDEIFSVNLGEEEKFTSNYVYQSRFLVLKDGDGLLFNGYAPDFARKSNVIKDVNGNSKFLLNKEYNVTLNITKYRVYVDVNDGFAKTSYGNGRNGVTDVAFYVRKGVEIKLSNVTFKGLEMPDLSVDKNVRYFIDNQLIVGFRDYFTSFDGVYFNRLSIIQNIKCTTRNSGAYQSGVSMDFYTDCRRLSIEYEVTDIPCEKWETQFGFLINGERIERPIKITEKDKVYSEIFEVPSRFPKYNRITIFFPYSVAIALRKIDYDENARFAKVEKRGLIHFYGDSITEGSECFNPACCYPTQVCMAYGYNCLNQAVSGRTFNDYNVLGEYFNKPDYVFIANGTNSFCSGTGNKDDVFNEMETNMKIVIESAKKEFPKAKIIGLLPIWRSDEQGEKFSLKETSEKIAEVYGKYKDVYVIDCHEFVPFDSKYFSNSQLALHPNSLGHDEYSKNLLKALENVMGEKPNDDYVQLAKRAITNIEK